MGRSTAREVAPIRVPWKFAVDVFVWWVAAFAAYLLRIPDPWPLPEAFLVYLAINLPVTAAIVWGFGLPRQAWRQATIHDLIRLGEAVVTGTVVMFLVGVVLYDSLGFPRTVPLIAGALALIGMGSARLVLRLREERARTHAAATGTKRALIVGAGSAGSWMAREVRRHRQSGITPIGFLDDDPAKRRLTIGGLPVLGTIHDLAAVAAAERVDQILITMPSAPGSTTRRVVEMARAAGLSCLILPGVTQILAGEIDFSRVRKVQVEDLLRRRPVDLDREGPEELLSDRVVLVTGAGGSIGAELVRQVARSDPKRVVLFGRGENSLHAIEQELRREIPDLDHVTVVGSATDRVKLARVMTAYAPDVVFHAAAHKHVPMMEFHPDEAVLNNVGGTRTVAEVAADFEVGRFVNISSDKAVNPVSMVGVTKAIGERVVRAVAAGVGPDQAFLSVRFGNVLGSRGSVVPIFAEQIRRGGPITITDPEMTRYFMTIPEASRLVIQAGALGENGAVYVLDMGTPVRIADLARDMIRLSGYDEDEIDIVYSGLRPGEKLTEELLTEEELLSATRYDDILMAHPEVPADPGFLACVSALTEAAERRDMTVLADRLSDLAPGFDLGERGEPPIGPM